MRREELTDLRLEDINIETGNFIICAGKTGARTANLGIALNFVKQMVDNYKARGRTKGYLFLHSKQEKGIKPSTTDFNEMEKYHGSGIQTAMRRKSEEFGIKFTAHSFRRGFAVWLYRKGASEKQIMQAGGWKKLETMHRYIKSVLPEETFRNLKSNIYDKEITLFDKFLSVN
jgi:integrase